MGKFMKKILCFTFIVFTLIPFSACSKRGEYRDDIACRLLTNELAVLCPAEDGYSNFNAEQIRYFFENTSLPTDYSMIYSTDTNDINEIGIFHCKNEEDTEEMMAIVEQYIKDMQETQVNFVSSYAPYEIPKLEGAEVRRYGNYVVYVVLDTNERRAAFATLEKELAIAENK